MFSVSEQKLLEISQRLQPDTNTVFDAVVCYP